MGLHYETTTERLRNDYAKRLRNDYGTRLRNDYGTTAKRLQNDYGMTTEQLRNDYETTAKRLMRICDASRTSDCAHRPLLSPMHPAHRPLLSLPPRCADQRLFLRVLGCEQCVDRDLLA